MTLELYKTQATHHSLGFGKSSANFARKTLSSPFCTLRGQSVMTFEQTVTSTNCLPSIFYSASLKFGTSATLLSDVSIHQLWCSPYLTVIIGLLLFLFAVVSLLQLWVMLLLLRPGLLILRLSPSIFTSVSYVVIIVLRPGHIIVTELSLSFHSLYSYYKACSHLCRNQALIPNYFWVV